MITHEEGWRALQHTQRLLEASGTPPEGIRHCLARQVEGWSQQGLTTPQIALNLWTLYAQTLDKDQAN